jgi:hypothetical protein
VVAENNAPSADTDEVKESREPTPEEIAAQEEEEKRRQEWQEERERRRAEFRERISNEIDMRKAFFAQIPTEGLAEEYQESHARLMEALDEVQAKMDVFGNSEMDRNERRAAMREMWQTGQEISGLMTMQRDVLLNDYAQQALGLNENQTQEFIEYMQTVDQMTTTDMMRGGRR